jgi:hypothetical protein
LVINSGKIVGKQTNSFLIRFPVIINNEMVSKAINPMVLELLLFLFLSPREG